MTKKFFAEAIGTMVLVLMGCGAAVFNGGAVSVSHILTIAFAFGLSVVAMAYAIGGITGCHINPAITLGALLTGRIQKSEAITYWIAQFLGAVVGSSILYVLVSGMGDTLVTATTTGANTYAEGNMVPAFIAETIFTMIFVLVVLGSTDKKFGTPNVPGLAIGLTLVLVHIVCIPLTGTSVNPARSFGPALFEGGAALQQLWLFILAPMVGAALSAFIWKFLEKQD